MNVACDPSQGRLNDFQLAVHKEFVEGSAICPEFIGTAIKFETGEAIAAALHWKGFRKNQELHAAIFANEDSSVWHAKLSKPMSGGKRYCAPTAPKGKGNRAYLPPIPQEIRTRIGAKYGVEIPSDGSFWEWLETHSEIPVCITEGGKKHLRCLVWVVSRSLSMAVLAENRQI